MTEISLVWELKTETPELYSGASLKNILHELQVNKILDVPNQPSLEFIKYVSLVDVLVAGVWGLYPQDNSLSWCFEKAEIKRVVKTDDKHLCMDLLLPIGITLEAFEEAWWNLNSDFEWMSDEYYISLKTRKLM